MTLAASFMLLSFALAAQAQGTRAREDAPSADGPSSCMAKPIRETQTPPPTAPLPEGQGRTATFRVVIDPEGRPSFIGISQGSGVPALDAAALAHLRTHWRWVAPECWGAGARVRIDFPRACTMRPLVETQTVPDTEPVAGGQGRSAEMQVQVGADGRVREIKLTRSSGIAALDQAGLEHVRAHWRWQPVTCQEGTSMQMLGTLVSIDFPVVVP